MNRQALDRVQRQGRILLLLQAVQRAGLSPIAVRPFHGLAFLANILAPVWDLSPLDGRLLKRQRGPFYPSLQSDLDRLVGKGMALLSDVSHTVDEDGAWRLEGRYRLNERAANDALVFLGTLREEAQFLQFATELAYALSTLSEAELSSALVEDATYSDPSIGTNNVIDFHQWNDRNPSKNAADYFGQLTSRGRRTTPGEKIHLYIRHLRRRLYV